ncbi:MAG: hypothetical protein ABIJ81_02270 [Patescibacteria group bacterium]
MPPKLKFARISVIRSANFELNAAKEKLEIVSGAAPPPFRIFAGEFFLKNAFELIQEYCTGAGRRVEPEGCPAAAGPGRAKVI